MTEWCYWTLPHRNAHRGVTCCDCVCVLPPHHVGAHQCNVEAANAEPLRAHMPETP